MYFFKNLRRDSTTFCLHMWNKNFFVLIAHTTLSLLENHPDNLKSKMKMIVEAFVMIPRFKTTIKVSAHLVVSFLMKHHNCNQDRKSSKIRCQVLKFVLQIKLNSYDLIDLPCGVCHHP